jgi:hypothetical protein
MKIFILIFLFEFLESKLNIIDLKYDNPLYFIPLRLSKIFVDYYFLLSTNLPISFYPTTKCKICTKLKLNKTALNLISIKENIKSPYYHNNYTGNIYTHKISIANLPYLNNYTKFIGFDQVSYKSTFSINGIFSLSYLNYNFNTTEKIFAFHFNKDKCQLHLGGYDNNLIKQDENLKTFKVIIDNNNTNNEIYNPIWYIEFNNILINDSPYVFNNNESVKLSFDIGTDKLHLPLIFFIENLDKIFPEKSYCQIDPSGFFKCNCDDNFRVNFGNITFYNNEKESFTIYPVDYIIYESGFTGSTCTIKIQINFENNLFIAGNTVMKNYYTIFDVGNHTFTAYRKEEKLDNIFFFILILIIICALAILVLGVYFFRKKCRRNNNNNNEIEENSFSDEENEDLIEDDIIDNVQEPINPGNGESSEETE